MHTSDFPENYTSLKSSALDVATRLANIRRDCLLELNVHFLNNRR